MTCERIATEVPPPGPVRARRRVFASAVTEFPSQFFRAVRVDDLGGIVPVACAPQDSRLRDSPRDRPDLPVLPEVGL